MRNAPILTALALLLLVGACSDSTRPDSDVLRGRVLDAAGRPVAGAAVVLQYETDPSLGGAPDKPATTITWSSPAADWSSAWITTGCAEEPFRVIEPGDVESGLFVWDGRDDAGRLAPDGVYTIHFVSGAGVSATDALLLRLGYADVGRAADIAPLAVTDQDGRFSLDPACLAFGFAQPATNEQGDPATPYTVVRVVRVWAFGETEGAVATSASVFVDPRFSADISLTIGE